MPYPIAFDDMCDRVDFMPYALKTEALEWVMAGKLYGADVQWTLAHAAASEARCLGQMWRERNR